MFGPCLWRRPGGVVLRSGDRDRKQQRGDGEGKLHAGISGDNRYWIKL
jgi:hypothetical protein